MKSLAKVTNIIFKNKIDMTLTFFNDFKWYLNINFDINQMFFFIKRFTCLFKKYLYYPNVSQKA